MKKHLIANWKMNPRTAAEARGILERVDDFLQGFEGRTDGFSLVFCPPFVFLDEVAQMLSQSHLLHDAELGAQDIAVRDAGALTGEVSGTQLVQSGVRYVIVGHSERRWVLGEDDATVNAKLTRALDAGLVPIVCLGERTREHGWEQELAAQTEATLAGLTPERVSRCFIAYEPVWAISTNPGARPDTPVSAVQSIGHIRATIADSAAAARPTFLYGGSVTPENAREFLTRDEISGVLIGGASVRAEDFCRILTVAATLP